MGLVNEIFPMLANAEGKSNQTKIQNSVANRASGQGSCSDFGASGNNFLASNFYGVSSWYWFYETDNLYYGSWEAQRLIDIPIEDALREPIEFRGLDEDEQKRLNEYLNLLDFHKKLEQCLRMERIYGGSAMFLGMRDFVDDPSIPIDASQVKQNDLLFLNPIHRGCISKANYESNPLEPGYCGAENYDIEGYKVANNRMMVFDGKPLCGAGSQLGYAGAYSAYYHRQDGMGYPLLLRARDDIIRAQGLRQAAYHLMQRASMLLFIGDIQTPSAFYNSRNVLSSLKEMLNFMSIHQAGLINSAPGSQADVKTLTANMAGIPDLIDKQLSVIANVDTIPLTKFLGISPGGLNSTGEADLENYNNRISAYQRFHIAPQIHQKLLPIILPAAGIDKSPEEVEVIFPPLWNLSEAEQSQVRQTDANTILSYVDRGIMDDEQAIEESKAREIFVTDVKPSLIDISEPEDDSNDFEEGNQDADSSQ